MQKPLVPLTIIVTLGLLFAVNTCQKQQTREARPSNGQTKPTVAFKMALIFIPDPPKMSKPTTFRLKLDDKNGKPVQGAAVNVSLVMPLMDMGKIEFTMADRGAGNYEGAGSFTMTGPWNVVVTANAGGQTAQQTFQVAVR